ncbi:MAG TPA: LLM class flavin-dependent oxidoreductase [bacterium]|nr:LLM class flavin-dependent oxidoreductase [bacterium]
MSPKTLEFGFLLPTRAAVMESGSPLDLSSLLEMAAEAEELGYDSIWIGDSVLARPRFEALTTLAAVAARTHQVRLGTAVYLSALRHPVLLANTVANLDILSAGRVTLGLGIGTHAPSVEAEFVNCGIPFRQRIGRFEEGISIMRRLWKGEKIDFRGKYYEVHGCSLGLHPKQTGGPPIWLAGRGEKAYRRVVLLADGWVPISPTPEVFAEGWTRIQALAAEAGRSLETLRPALYVTLTAHSDRNQALREMETYMEAYYGVPYAIMSQMQGCCPGTPLECRNWLQEFIRQGARSLVLRFASPKPAEQLRFFAREILPALVSVS